MIGQGAVRQIGAVAAHLAGIQGEAVAIIGRTGAVGNAVADHRARRTAFAVFSIDSLLVQDGAYQLSLPGLAGSQVVVEGVLAVGPGIGFLGGRLKDGDAFYVFLAGEGEGGAALLIRRILRGCKGNTQGLPRLSGKGLCRKPVGFGAYRRRPGLGGGKSYGFTPARGVNDYVARGGKGDGSGLGLGIGFCLTSAGHGFLLATSQGKGGEGRQDPILVFHKGLFLCLG